VARNLGATPVQMLTQIILPAISFDIFTGIRLALGVAWVVLVPAELLGVTSGLGYAIKDARETLSYDQLTAMVLTIGVIGYAARYLCALLIKRFSWHRGDAMSTHSMSPQTRANSTTRLGRATNAATGRRMSSDGCSRDPPCDRNPVSAAPAYWAWNFFGGLVILFACGGWPSMWPR
jgi:hypothetical protein